MFHFSGIRAREQKHRVVCVRVCLAVKEMLYCLPEDSTTSHHSGRTGGPGFPRHHQHWQGVTGSRVAQADFTLIIWPKLALKSWSSCFYIPSTGMTGKHHRAWYLCGFKLHSLVVRDVEAYGLTCYFYIIFGKYMFMSPCFLIAFLISIIKCTQPNLPKIDTFRVWYVCVCMYLFSHRCGSLRTTVGMGLYLLSCWRQHLS